MRIPKVDGRRKPPLGDGAAAFWSAATAIEGSVTTRGFVGDLSLFGFLPDRSSEILTKLRDAMSVASELLPDLNPLVGSRHSQKKEQNLQRLGMWENDPSCRFWFHPSENTLAITLPYSFAKPYGNAGMVLINYNSVDDKTQQNSRNEKLAALDAAKHSTRRLVHLGPADAYVARGGIFGGTFAFAKHCVIGGRDRETTVSSGFSLSNDDAKHTYSSANMPFLFLEIGFEEVAV